MRSSIISSAWEGFSFKFLSFVLFSTCAFRMLNSKSKYCTPLSPPHTHIITFLINKQQKYRSYQHHNVPMSSNEAMIIPFFKKKRGKKPSSIFYSSASVTSASSSICNSAFEWGLTSHGGWPSSWLGKERREKSTQIQQRECQIKGVHKQSSLRVAQWGRKSYLPLSLRIKAGNRSLWGLEFFICKTQSMNELLNQNTKTKPSTLCYLYWRREEAWAVVPKFNSIWLWV